MPDEAFIRRNVKAGDVLLYDRKGFFNSLIRLKTGSKYSHCEVYAGNNMAWASRNGEGCYLYCFDARGLVGVYRPITQPNLQKADEWFQSSAKGQKYDWLGLLAFWFARWQGAKNRKMFCSEFVVRFFVEAELPLFASETDADSVSPGMIPLSGNLRKVWAIL